MLDFAINHKEELIKTHQRFLTSNLEHCKYWLYENYISTYILDVEASNWCNTQMVSITNGKVTGYIKVSHDRSQKRISKICLISYKLETNPILYKDTIKFVDELFKSGIKKIKFQSVYDSPAHIINQKLVDKYNGRVIGISKNDIELIDGKTYDTISFEIFNPEFYKNV
jgi:hypothetical protein